MDYYIDHLAYPAYVATPTGTGWPLPAQDGDGLGTGLATPAIASIDCTGVTAAAGNTLTIAGASHACVASGATAGLQFNASSGAALASNLVALINSGLNRVPTSVLRSMPQVRSAFFARLNPGNSQQVQIMTRAGAAAFNFATNPAFVIEASGFSPAPAITQFAGGTSGAWGYLWNDAAILPAGKVAGSYGATQNNLTGTGDALLAPSAAPMTEFDWVWLRAKDQELLYAGAAGTRSCVTPFQLVVDANNEKWPNTLGKKLTIGQNGTASGGFNWDVSALTTTTPIYFAFGANVRDAAVFRGASTQSNTASNQHALIRALSGQDGRIVFENVLFDERSAFEYRCGLNIESGWKGAKGVYFRDVTLRWIRATGLMSAIIVANAVTGTHHFHVDGMRVVMDSATSHTGIFNWAGAVPTQVTAKNCVALAPGGTVKIAAPITSASTQFLRSENLEGFSLVTAGLLGLVSGGLDAGVSTQIAVGPNKRTQIETTSTLVEWLPGAGFPTLASEMEDGLPWSWRLTWAATTQIYTGAPVDQVTLTKRAPLADGVRTLKTEILLDAALSALGSDSLSCAIAYTDTAGKLRSESTAPMGAFRASVPLPASTASWNLGSYGAHVARKLEVTTQYPVKGGTDIMATVQFLRPSPGAPSFVFVEPDLGVV